MALHEALHEAGYRGMHRTYHCSKVFEDTKIHHVIILDEMEFSNCPCLYTDIH